MAASNDQAYSTLEYVPPTEFYNKKENALPDYSGLQVVPGSGNAANEAGLEVAPPKQEAVPDVAEHYTPPPVAQAPAKSRRKWLIIGAVVLLVVIIAAVVGGVVGSRHKSTKSSNTNPSSAANSNGTSSGNTTSTSTTPRRNIAAVSWPSNPANQTRLYFRDNAGEIIETVVVAGSNVTSSIISDNASPRAPLVNDSKLGSPIAAAVARPGAVFTITVFYLDADNIIHDIIYERKTTTWTEGTIASKKYVAAANSSLSAMYNQCRYCANTTILAFQDANNFVQVANGTSSGWQLTQLDITAVKNTGLGLQPYYWQGQEDQLDLFYQRKDLKLAMASWVSSTRTNKAPVWAQDQLWSVAPAGTPIAAASSYQSTGSGADAWIQVLSTASTGITVTSWDGNAKNWSLVENQQSALSNISTPGNFDALTVTATGAAFATINSNGTSHVKSWQLSDDWSSWQSGGSVPVEQAWN